MRLFCIWDFPLIGPNASMCWNITNEIELKSPPMGIEKLPGLSLASRIVISGHQELTLERRAFLPLPRSPSLAFSFWQYLQRSPF